MYSAVHCSQAYCLLGYLPLLPALNIQVNCVILWIVCCPILGVHTELRVCLEMLFTLLLRTFLTMVMSYRGVGSPSLGNLFAHSKSHTFQKTREPEVCPVSLCSAQ